MFKNDKASLGEFFVEGLDTLVGDKGIESLVVKDRE